MRRFILLTLYTLLLLPQLSSAQKQSNVWCFGLGAGIDFNGGVPTVFTSAINQDEGSASVADKTTGQLLFYTDGMTVWNRNHKVMLNGTGLASNPSSTQAAVIVPKPRSSTEYYVFTSDAGEYINPPNDGIHYSIIDMSQDGGLGALTLRNVPLLAPATEKLTAIEHCNGNDTWVIVHGWESDAFYAYLVTRYGIAPPVITRIGARHGVGGSRGDPYANSIGYLQASSDGTRLASVIYGTGAVELFDFDNRTGQLSNAISLTADSIVYGASFSPDGSKLYVTTKVNRGSLQFDPNAVMQFDLGSNQQAAIQSSRTVVASDDSVGMMALQLAPDGKIYVARINDTWLGVINNPNASGAACNFSRRGINLAPHRSLQGLPNMVNTYFDPTVIDCRPPTADFIPNVDSICQGNCIRYTDRTVDNPTSWEWTFEGGSPATFSGKIPPQVCYANSGNYRVQLIASNENGSDTAVRTVVVIPLPGADAGPDLSICFDESRQLSAGGNGSYQWSPGTGLSCTTCQKPVATPTKTTTYRLMVTNSFGCVSIDSMTITVNPLPKADAGKDRTICSGDSTQLSVDGDGAYQWSPATGLSCTTCKDPIASPTTTTTYRITVTSPAGCRAVDSVKVSVVPSPAAEAGPDRSLCLEESAVLGGSGNGSYQWSPATGLSCTNCRNPIASPTTTTVYHLTVTSSNGCQSSDSTTVHVDPSPRLVRFAIDKNYRVYPGVGLTVPVMLLDLLDSARISDLLFTIHWQPGMLRLVNGTDETVGLMQDGTLLHGWKVNVVKLQEGLFSARFTAPAGEYLKGIGALLNLRFLTFLSSASSSPLPFEIELTGAPCTKLVIDAGLVRLDSVCGLNLRLIEGTGENYSLAQNTPNPFTSSTTIDFSLGLDGPTTLEIFNASGQKVTTLVNGTLAAGTHQVAWNSASFPSGTYYYRVTSGTWSEEKSMVKR
jgi:PKD repeat protein